MKLKCLVTASLTRESLNILRKYADIVYEDWRVTKKLYWGDEILYRIDKHKVNSLIVEVDAVDEDVIERSNLVFIGCCRETLKNIAVDKATEKGVPVLYTPGRNSNAVAEMTLAHILNVLRKVNLSDRVLRSDIKIDSPEEFVHYYNLFTGAELTGKTVGLIGLGKIGFRVAQLLKGFNVKILVYDPYVKKNKLNAVGCERVDLSTLLKTSDIITIHCNVTDETVDLIGEAELKKMKRTACIFNLASPVIVNEEALLKALEEKWIAGAGLDVFENEPVDSENKFLKFSNVIVTPHTGGASREVIENQSKMIISDVVRLLRKQTPKFIANPEVLK